MEDLSVSCIQSGTSASERRENFAPWGHQRLSLKVQPSLKTKLPEDHLHGLRHSYRHYMYHTNVLRNNKVQLLAILPL